MATVINNKFISLGLSNTSIATNTLIDNSMDLILEYNQHQITL